MSQLNPKIVEDTEAFEESWNNKLNRDFTINGKVDKNSLIEYIQQQIAYQGINDYFDEDPMVQYVA